MSTSDSTRNGRRGRGSRAGLTQARIVEAARGLGAESITVQAVADRLGVDRAAVHHHVNDLDTLRELIALDAFTVRFAPITVAPGADWREACRLLAVSMHDAVLASGGLGAYVRLTPSDVAVLEPVEQTLGIMIAAGFDDETAARSLTTLAGIAAATARERVIAGRQTGHPQAPAVRRAIEENGDVELPVLYRLAQADLVAFDDAQLQASIDLVLDGMATRLRSDG